MSPVNETVTRLQQVGGVPGSARVVLRYHTGLAGQEREIGLTLRDLLGLAAFAASALDDIAEESGGKRAGVRADDRRESDRHPPRPL